MLRQLAPKYIDTGKAKVIYRHFAVIGPESEQAAEAAECAGDQNKFWDYANYLLSNQAGENAGGFSSNNLKSFAGQLGLEATAFNACLDSGKYKDTVQADTDEGRRRAVSGTPTFFINGQRVEGIIPADQLAAMIDSLAAK